jgi:hypothetical protein
MQSVPPLAERVAAFLAALCRISTLSPRCLCGSFSVRPRGVEAGQKTIDAVIRNIEIIGEAARNIPADVRAQMPEVAWIDAADMRNAIIHA